VQTLQCPLMTQSGHRTLKLAALTGHFREAGLTRYDALSGGEGEAMKRHSKARGKTAKAERRKVLTPRHSTPSKGLPRSTVTGQETDTARLTRERDEALEREKATAEVLRVISSSSGRLEPIFQAMLENAVRICGANFGVLFLREGDAFRRMAMHNPPPSYIEEHRRAPVARPSAASAHGRALSPQSGSFTSRT
jgi:hypothetical protein